jgi:hypothetical protein
VINTSGLEPDYEIRFSLRAAEGGDRRHTNVQKRSQAYSQVGFCFRRREEAEPFGSIFPPKEEEHKMLPFRERLKAGVRFCAYEKSGTLSGVMGVQQVQDKSLIRHAYVRTKLPETRNWSATAVS